MPAEATNATCSDGLAGLTNNDNTVCCDSRCLQCGGTGCGDAPGLSADDCCSSDIEFNGQLCSVTGSAPCVLDAPGELFALLVEVPLTFYGTSSLGEYSRPSEVAFNDAFDDTHHLRRFRDPLSRGSCTP